MSPDPAARLAINGGPAVRVGQFRSRAASWHLGSAEGAAVIALVERAIREGISPGYNGPEEEAFCAEFSDLLGGGYADAVSSGTAALYVALRALEIEPYSEVVVSALTDPGGLMPIPLQNLIPVIADTAPGSYNSGPEQIAAEITDRTAAIVVAHIGGEPADVAAISELGRQRGIPLIEDCAQAHGARLHDRPLGSFGDLAVFSTMNGKHVATGAQGGLVFTRDRSLYERVRRASDRGKPFFLPQEATNSVASLNFNLNEWACAIGRVQLRRLPDFVSSGASVVRRLGDCVGCLRSVSLPPLIPGARPNYWFLRLRVHEEAISCGKKTFCAALAAEGLPITERYTAAMPHAMDWFVRRRVFGSSGLPWSSPDYRGDRDRVFPCPNAETALDTHFNLHCHEHWTAKDIGDAIAILDKVDRAYGRDP